MQTVQHASASRAQQRCTFRAATSRLASIRARCAAASPRAHAPTLLRPLASLQCEAPRPSLRHATPASRNVRCAAAAGSSSDAPEAKGLGQTAILGMLFGGWYLANIYFNIFNKQVLKSYCNPLTCTNLQFAVGGCLALLFWASGAVKRPTINAAALKSILPLAVVHTLGNLLTNCSLGAVAVSFTHTIKAMEPFFSVVLSALFLNDKPSLGVILTLFPIVGGVALASLSEASFNWFGFLSAMGSNITFQSRNVLSKKLLIKKDGMDNISLFSIITIMSFFLLLPFTLAIEGVTFTPQAMQSMGITNSTDIIRRALLAGVCFHSYQQLSYMILSRVSPVTHSIGNCVKRIVVIAASVIVFRNPVSIQNAAGTAVALAGVFLYSQVKRSQGKAKAT